MRMLTCIGRTLSCALAARRCKPQTKRRATSVATTRDVSTRQSRGEAKSLNVARPLAQCLVKFELVLGIAATITREGPRAKSQAYPVRARPGTPHPLPRGGDGVSTAARSQGALMPRAAGFDNTDGTFTVIDVEGVLHEAGCSFVRSVAPFVRVLQGGVPRPARWPVCRGVKVNV